MLPTSTPATLAEVMMGAIIVLLQVGTFLASQWLHRRRARALDTRLASDRAEALELVRVLSGAPPAIAPLAEPCARCSHGLVAHRDGGACVASWIDRRSLERGRCDCVSFVPPARELPPQPPLVPTSGGRSTRSDPTCLCGHPRSAHWASMAACKGKGCGCYEFASESAAAAKGATIADIDFERRVRNPTGSHASDLCELCFATRDYCDGVGRAQKGARCCNECSHREAS